MIRSLRRCLSAVPLVALALVAACGGDDASPAATDATTTAPGTDAGWTFTDDRGVTIELPAAPQRIVAYVGTAAVLWDFGVRPIGTFGPLRNDDGSPQSAAGNIDLDAVVSVGDDWDGANLEALAALEPDLVVSGGTDDPWVIADQLDAIGQIAPIALIEVSGAPAGEILANYERFAVAVGVDPSGAELSAARTAYEEARAALGGAIEANPNLSVLVTSAFTEGLYIANPNGFPDLLDFQQLGLDIVVPSGGDEFWEMLSWELADRYPSDVILHDVREYSLQPDVLSVEQPIWNVLPAVASGQVGPWSAEAILSYQGLAAVYAELTDVVQTASADVV